MLKKYLPWVLLYLIRLIKNPNNDFQRDPVNTLKEIQEFIQNEFLSFFFKFLTGCMFLSLIVISFIKISSVVEKISFSTTEGLILSGVGYFVVMVLSIFGLFYVFRRKKSKDLLDHSEKTKNSQNIDPVQLTAAFLSGFYNGFYK